ncbi:hypothetical protein A9Q99_18815 [Gammaproteobacteria bacterium 45_16_T64]|nr:hypothetical protein A9Q99_18815 [Gammaproteobacteria bacterium 45_16_T64]
MTLRYSVTYFFALLFVGLTLAPTIYAKQLWSDNSLSLLRGNNYEIGAESRTVLTFEHVSGHSWGDMFLFVDRLESDNDDNETYWELSPRLSLGKLFNKDLTMGPVKDVLLTTTAEIAENFTHYLIGPAIDLNVPGFAYLQLNVYLRDNEAFGGATKADANWQFTPVWGVPFSIGNAQFLYDGFIDWRSGDGDNNTELNFTSQLKWDMGALWQSPKVLYVGVEYVYWDTKFGIKDSDALQTDERNLNALIKVHF